MTLLAGLRVYAQFYTTGNENGRQKWSSVSTSHYQVIYPMGLDSLGKACAIELEKACLPVSGNLGWQPNELYSTPLPVLLHTEAAYNNGYVTWCPRRMELFLGYDAYDRISLPRLQQLAIHEGRHVSQMQIGQAELFLYGTARFLVGELTTGMLAALGGPCFLEGDAVVAETALTGGGRGRSADFLEYLRACYDEGEYRNFWQWRYGSQRYYAPDHYRIGYLMEAGVRSFWNDADFTERFYRNLLDRHGISPNNYDRTIRQATGMSLKVSYNAVAERIDSIWRKEADARGPYTSTTALTENRSFYTQYLSPCAAADRLYAIRKSIDRCNALVEIGKDGTVKSSRTFASTSSRLQYSSPTGRLFWSEYRPDTRWEMVSKSAICYMDSSGRRGTLEGSRKLYNPAPCQVVNEIAAVCDKGDGGCHIEILDAMDGSLLRTVDIPDGMEAIECCWIGTDLYFSASTREGMGIYRAADLGCVLNPKHVTIKQLGSEEGKIVMVCDLSGVNELYSLHPDSGTLLQLSSSRIGSSDYLFDGDTVYLSQPTSKGRMLTICPRDSLMSRTADWNHPHRYVLADSLSRGEHIAYNDSMQVSISEVTPYKKLRHAFNLHSWAPIYCDIDEAASLSFATLSQVVSPGATVCTQNTLGTLYGWGGIKLLNDEWHWRPSGHIKLNYRGLYPIIELRADYNTRDSRLSRIAKDVDSDGKDILVLMTGYGKPLLSSSIDCYIPLRFNSGGWLRGVVPQLSYGVSNDGYSTTIKGKDTAVSDYRILSRATMSVRAYTMQPTASSCIYPRLGIGGQIGYTARPALSKFFGDKLFAQVYAYLPGLYTTHGVKLTLLTQKELGNSVFGEAYANILPRGCSSSARSAATMYPNAVKLTLDYAMPLFSIDASLLCPFTYIRNFELIPYADISLLSGARSKSVPASCVVMSAGTELNMVLSNLSFIPYATRIGVRAGYAMQDKLYEGGGLNAGLVFSIDL